MPQRNSPAKQSIPWWLDGEQECPHCHLLYAYELEVRCLECDGPSCPHCVSRHVEIGIVCVGCNVDQESSHG